MAWNKSEPNKGDTVEDLQNLLADAAAAVAKYCLHYQKMVGSGLSFAQSAHRVSGSIVYRDLAVTQEDLDEAADQLDAVGSRVVAYLHGQFSHTYWLGDEMTVYYSRSTNGIDRGEDGNHHAFGLDREREPHPSAWTSPADWLRLFRELPAILPQLAVAA